MSETSPTSPPDPQPSATAQPAPVPLSGGTPFVPLQIIEVTTPSGQSLKVLGVEEEAFYTTERDKYLQQNTFTHSSDFLDLDRLLFLELLAYRNSRWLAEDQDYDGITINRRDCERTLKEANDQISRIKGDLGLTKSAREKAQAESVGAYITELKERAREFGVNREKQLIKAITLVQQLFSIVGSFDRADEIEREKLGFRDEAEIVDWIRSTMRPEFDEVDKYFRTHAQKYWVKKL